MNLKPTKTTNDPIPIQWIFALLLASSSCGLLAYYMGGLARSNALYLVAALLLVVVAVVVARMAMVAWITVLVLLTFVGNRRRVLVREGSKITEEVGSYLIRVMISERKGAFTFAFAAAVSLLAMAGLVESVSLSQRWYSVQTSLHMYNLTSKRSS